MYGINLQVEKLTLFFMDPRTRDLLCLPSKQFASNQPLPSILVTWAYSIVNINKYAVTIIFQISFHIITGSSWHA
jgi:hypothetical protein